MALRMPGLGGGHEDYLGVASSAKAVGWREVVLPTVRLARLALASAAKDVAR